MQIKNRAKFVKKVSSLSVKDLINKSYEDQTSPSASDLQQDN